MKVWIIWNINAGKSTIFNKLIWSHRAIITEMPWTTRQILSEKFFPKEDFLAELYDSPWLEDFQQEVEYIKQIIKKSDLLIFVLDAKKWLTSKDQQIKEMIIKEWKKDKTVLVVNKLDWKVHSRNIKNRKKSNDSGDVLQHVSDFYSLWFDNLIPVSAINDQWIDKLKDFIQKYIIKNNFSPINEKEGDYLSVIFVWAPNTWKSTLINKFAQDEVSTVKETAGTTLDYIKANVEFWWTEFVLYDTAGIKKRSKTKWLEKIAMNKTEKLIQYKNPVAIILIDVYNWITHNDKTIISKIEKLNVPMIIALNKSDLLEKKELLMKMKQITQLLSFISHVPIIQISASSGYNLDKLLKFAEDIQWHFNKKINTWKLNTTINRALIENPPKFTKNKICKIYYMTQVQSAPPKFFVFINKKDRANFAFKKRIINTLRKNFWFIWCPILIEFRERSAN